ncbi:ac transposable element-derived [Brachionus plicatilis]|uniref:Ac transposable element-derived n=1 Tax=Brachionus plicatilis TaxID=10195 RepID=A0A3M7R8I6_BRAPC|nr:ac transposable element-derived [Brachionus plicatilis]
MTLALIPLDKIKDAFNIILDECPFTDEKLFAFVRYFKKQWLNGTISPQIWNHHTSQKRTNNNLEGFHSKLTKLLPKYHPKFSDVLKCIIKEDAKTRNDFLSFDSKTYQAKKDLVKDLKIQITQEEFRRNFVDFKTYFEKLTCQVMYPYDQDINESLENEKDEDENNNDDRGEVEEQTITKIKVSKLVNMYIHFDFTRDIDQRLNQIKQIKN